MGILCQTAGDLRSNPLYGSSRRWCRLANGAYVHFVYITARFGQLTVASNEFTVRPIPPVWGSKPAWMLVRYHASVTGWA